MTEIQHLGAKIKPEKFTFEWSQQGPALDYSFMPHLKKPHADAREKKFHGVMVVFNDI